MYVHLCSISDGLSGVCPCLTVHSSTLHLCARGTPVHPSRLGLTWRCQTQAGINHHLQFPRGGARAAALAHHNPPCRPSLHLCCRPRPRCRHHHHHHRRRRPYLVVIAAIAATAIASASGARRGASGARQGHVRGEASAARRGVWTSVDQHGSAWVNVDQCGSVWISVDLCGSMWVSAVQCRSV